MSEKKVTAQDSLDAMVVEGGLTVQEFIDFENAPVHKVGLVIVRYPERPESEDQTNSGPELLLVRPRPKREGETAPFVLPRGSRTYTDRMGNVFEMRTSADAQKVAEKIKQKESNVILEDLETTLVREAAEEAGVPPELLRNGARSHLGERVYQSTGDRYKIDWHILVLRDQRELSQLNAHPPDAAETKWVTLSKMRELLWSKQEGERQARVGYLEVAEEALTQVQSMVTSGTLMMGSTWKS